MKVKRLVLIIAGIASLAFGTLGIFLPLLPTVPLYLLTLFCFTASSEGLRNWFVGTRLFKRYLQPYLQAGGLPLRAKILLILFVSLQIAVAAFFVKSSPIGLLILAGLYAGFLFSMIRIVKTLPREQKNSEQKNKTKEGRKH